MKSEQGGTSNREWSGEMREWRVSNREWSGVMREWRVSNREWSGVMRGWRVSNREWRCDEGMESEQGWSEQKGVEWCDERMESEQQGVEWCDEGMKSEQGGASNREWSGGMREWRVSKGERATGSGVV
jgi:hypothetical protein